MAAQMIQDAVNSQRQKAIVLLAWCLLLMLAWGLWLWRLDASDLTFDETATYFVAHRPLLDILNYLRGAVREHPPVYYLLIHGWMALAGTSEFSLRLFSVGAGLVALALTGWLARLAMGRSAGAASLVPAVLLAVVPGMAYYVRDARMYSLGVVWTVLSAGLFLRDWLPAREWSPGGSPARAAIISLVAVHFLALFTHYYLLLAILVQPLALLIARRWRPLLAWCAIHSLPALAGLGWLWLAPGLQATTDRVWRGLGLIVPTRFQFFRLLGKILFSPDVRVNFSLLNNLLALVGGGVLLALWRRRAIGGWLLLALLVPLVLVYILPRSTVPRYLVFLIPVMALALGYLCVIPLYLVKSRWLAWGAIFGLALVGMRLLIGGGLYQAITLDRSHYGHTLKTIQAHARPGDAVLFYGPWQAIQFEYYDPGEMPPITALPPSAPPQLQPDEAEPVLEELLAQHDRLWVLPASVSDVDPAHFVAGWLHTHAHAVWETGDFSLYLPPLPPDAPTRQAGLTFGQVLYLDQVAYEPQPVLPGEPLRLTLYWSPLDRLQSDVRLTLKLTDQNGHEWHAADSLPGAWVSPPSTWQPGQVITDYEGLIVPQGAPPGEYVVRLMVTDEGSGEPLLVGGDKETDLLTVTVSDFVARATEPAPAPVHDGLSHRVYLPFIAAQWPQRGPVLYGLPNAGATVFCSPDDDVCLTLAGYESDGLRFRQGYPIPLTLHWLSPSRPLPQLQLRLRVTHRAWLPLLQDVSVLTRTLPLAPTYPAPLWAPDRLVMLPTVLTLPPDAPTGPAQVTLEVLGSDDNPWLATGGDSAFSLLNITVEGRPVLRRLPSGMTRIQADFGDEIGLRGYRVEGDLRPGDQLRVTYAWYAQTHPSAIYAVFNHLETADGVLVAQADSWPQEGRMLTTQWQAGEYVEDVHTLTIPSDAPPGPYTLYIGLYNSATNERLPAFLDGQRVIDDRVRIPVSEAAPGEDGR